MGTNPWGATFPQSPPCPGCGVGGPARQIYCHACGMQILWDGPPAKTVMERARRTFELHARGVRHYRTRMRREHPRASNADIDAMVRAWLQKPQEPCVPLGNRDLVAELDFHIWEAGR